MHFDRTKEAAAPGVELGRAIPTVFIADHDCDSCARLQQLLLGRHYNVSTFVSGKSLLVALKPPPACLIAEVSLPDMTGIDLQNHLLNLGIKIPIIFLTDKGTVETAVEAMRQGAYDFFEKPVIERILLTTIERAVQSKSENTN